MQEYNVQIGVYARTYCSFLVKARDDHKALEEAIAKFKRDEGDIQFNETDWGNTAHPSVVRIENNETGALVVEGHDFALNGDDHREMASRHMLEILEDLVNSPNAKQNAMWDKARAVIARAKGEMS